MKSIHRVLSFCAAISVTAVTGFAQTTMEDYEYIAREMLNEAKEDRPANERYTTGHEHAWTTPIGGGSTGKRKSVTSVIYETSTSRPVGVLVALRRTDTDFLRTICIPLPSSEQAVLDRAWQDLVRATSEWSTQAHTYFWHVALSFAAEVEANGYAPSDMEKAEHAIDKRLTACLAKLNPDTYEWGMVHPEYGCWNQALQDWLTELKLIETRLMAAVEDKAGLKQHLDAWHVYYDNHMANEEGFEDFGGSLHQIQLLQAQITIVKARIEMLETYLGIRTGDD